MELHRSAQETEEHKNKRLTAKHELMVILRTLEAERAVSAKLRDSLKFTFTPKAQSQQQLLQESLQDFETELFRLSRRLNKPLPAATEAAEAFDDGFSGEDPASPAAQRKKHSSGTNKSEVDSAHLISHLENETQRVSQGIMALISNIERFHVILKEDRNCAASFADFLLTGQATDETRSMTSRSRNS
eukprot:CAMPEP_0118714256 /NCGR_PEP_ID=MMETSP0800-20121206/26076_1 /TAXON_ID=210618 ORGANISM="Striatella unipunctata, Strain CCMP2910" /NCGR_SAMPLE_ID=MMETSP0800 /ASSEMBLY_ACC=CAM_ASM_000638 /LENGTH=187 /DNA_ID=CAMNT_0006620009 /DNA_START=199 /DNA_END=762 /DNA_ORIENTATION=-